MSPWLREQIQLASKRLEGIEPARLEIIRRKYANRSIANYRIATPTNSIEQPHQTKTPTQPQGANEQSP